MNQNRKKYDKGVQAKSSWAHLRGNTKEIAEELNIDKELNSRKDRIG